MTTIEAAEHPAEHGHTATAPSVLVVEDDRMMAESMAQILQAQGCAVVHANCGRAALQQLAAGAFDALVLDIGLPDIDGFEVLNRLPVERPYGVLIVSAYDRVDQRVRGLDLGADDYLVKPFASEEFEARMRALLRRSRTRRNKRIEIAGLAVDVAGKRAWVNEVAMELTAREWTVLMALLARIGQVVGKDQLQELLAGDRQSVTENAIEVYVSRLRTRLDGSGVNIRTLRGFGYMIEEPRAAPAR
jgi:two-component system OmpR family response regulator